MKYLKFLACFLLLSAFFGCVSAPEVKEGQPAESSISAPGEKTAGEAAAEPQSGAEGSPVVVEEGAAAVAPPAPQAANETSVAANVAVPAGEAPKEAAAMPVDPTAAVAVPAPAPVEAEPPPPPPEDPAKLVSEAVDYLHDGYYNSALEKILKAREINPQVSGGLLLHAKILYAKGDEAEGLALLEELISKGEGGDEALYSYMNWQERRGKSADSLAFLEKLASEVPEIPDELLGALGWNHFILGDSQKAVSNWEKINDAAEVKKYALYLARIHQGSGDYQKAENWAKVAMATKDAGAKRLASLELAEIFVARGRVSSAVAILEEILKENPEDYEALNAMGLIEMGKENPKKAGEYLKRAVEAGSSKPEGWNNLGLVLRAGGDHKGAEENYKKALAADPNFAPAQKNLAILYDKYMGRYAEAISLYESYLKIRPADEEAQKWLKAAQRQAGGGQ